MQNDVWPSIFYKLYIMVSTLAIHTVQMRESVRQGSPPKLKSPYGLYCLLLLVCKGKCHLVIVWILKTNIISTGKSQNNLLHSLIVNHKTCKFKKKSPRLPLLKLNSITNTFTFCTCLHYHFLHGPSLTPQNKPLLVIPDLKTSPRTFP